MIGARGAVAAEQLRREAAEAVAADLEAAEATAAAELVAVQAELDDENVRGSAGGDGDGSRRFVCIKKAQACVGFGMCQGASRWASGRTTSCSGVLVRPGASDGDRPRTRSHLTAMGPRRRGACRRPSAFVPD